jgi:methylenetetrahydrofolate reductase (NADPH)
MSSFSISFEFFPPKTEEGLIYFTKTAQQLIQTHPSFFSVTFGAGGSSRQGTIDAIKILQEESHTPIAAHLACIGLTKENLLSVLHCYKTMGIKHLVALRGDLPAGMEENSGDFAFALDLVAFIKANMGSQFRIEVAAYPEFHPEAQKAKDDILNLKRKFDAGADSAITQYFFSADAYFYFLDECYRHGIHSPIVPGIMPITHFEKLKRFSSLCGAEIPRWIGKRLESYGEDIQSIKKFGIEIIYDLCEKLIAGGAPGLHFYTLNQAEASLTLCQLLLDKRKIPYRMMSA